MMVSQTGQGPIPPGSAY